MADKLVRGEVYLRAITFREGLTIRQMAQVFADRGFGPADGFVKAASDGSRVAAYDPDARDLEGYLFPDTYTLPRSATAEQLVSRMVAQFEKALTVQVRANAAARGLSIRQLVTLSLSFDHRVVDGVPAGAFLRDVKHAIEASTLES